MSMVPALTTGELLTPKIDAAGTVIPTLETEPPAHATAPESTRLPDESTATQCPEMKVPEVVAKVVVLPEAAPVKGVAPKPPPSTGAFAVSVLDEASVAPLTKNGMPPLVPVVVIPNVPAVTIGEPVTLKIEETGTVSATEVTVPPLPTPPPPPPPRAVAGTLRVRPPWMTASKSFVPRGWVAGGTV